MVTALGPRYILYHYMEPLGQVWRFPQRIVPEVMESFAGLRL